MKYIADFSRSLFVVLLALMETPSLRATQAAYCSSAVLARSVPSTQSTGSQCILRSRILRSIEDHGTGAGWVLMRDPAQPAGPAKLIMVRPVGPGGHAAQGDRRSVSKLPAPPLIRAGESIVLSSHADHAESRLEATALSSASEGELMTARLKFGGHVVHAIVTGAARAELTGTHEVRR